MAICQIEENLQFLRRRDVLGDASRSQAILGEEDLTPQFLQPNVQTRQPWVEICTQKTSVVEMAERYLLPLPYICAPQPQATVRSHSTVACVCHRMPAPANASRLPAKSPVYKGVAHRTRCATHLPPRVESHGHRDCQRSVLGQSIFALCQSNAWNFLGRFFLRAASEVITFPQILHRVVWMDWQSFPPYTSDVQLVQSSKMVADQVPNSKSSSNPFHLSELGRAFWNINQIVAATLGISQMKPRLCDQAAPKSTSALILSNSSRSPSTKAAGDSALRIHCS